MVIHSYISNPLQILPLFITTKDIEDLGKQFANITEHIE
jgi:hypothetical protein